MPNASVVVLKLEVCLANDVLLFVIVPLRILMGTKARQVRRFDAAISEEQERRSFLFCISVCKEYCWLVQLLYTYWCSSQSTTFCSALCWRLVSSLLSSVTHFLWLEQQCWNQLSRRFRAKGLLHELIQTLFSIDLVTCKRNGSPISLV